MFIYCYALFLRRKDTGECQNQLIEVETDDGEDILTFHSLIEKLKRNTNLFDNGYTLISMMVVEVKEVEQGSLKL